MLDTKKSAANWRMIQSDAKLLSTSNSLDHQGKYKGIFAISAALGSNLDQMNLVFSGVFVEIPYSADQGIILEEQGIFSM